MWCRALFLYCVLHVTLADVQKKGSLCRNVTGKTDAKSLFSSIFAKLRKQKEPAAAPDKLVHASKEYEDKNVYVAGHGTFIFAKPNETKPDLKKDKLGKPITTDTPKTTTTPDSPSAKVTFNLPNPKRNPEILELEDKEAPSGSKVVLEGLNFISMEANTDVEKIEDPPKQGPTTTVPSLGGGVPTTTESHPALGGGLKNTSKHNPDVGGKDPATVTPDTKEDEHKPMPTTTKSPSLETGEFVTSTSYGS